MGRRFELYITRWNTTKGPRQSILNHVGRRDRTKKGGERKSIGKLRKPDPQPPYYKSWYTQWIRHTDFNQSQIP
jgi:hypothetical protein